MSVLIEGMEMPKSCYVCRFCDGTAETEIGVCAYCCVDGGHHDAYANNDCPLVPVPPHGDLIDRKTAYDSLLDGMVMTGYQSRALDCISDFYVPTIISAEEATQKDGGQDKAQTGPYDLLYEEGGYNSNGV